MSDLAGSGLEHDPTGRPGAEAVQESLDLIVAVREERRSAVPGGGWPRSRRLLSGPFDCGQVAVEDCGDVRRVDPGAGPRRRLALVEQDIPRCQGQIRRPELVELTDDLAGFSGARGRHDLGGVLEIIGVRHGLSGQDQFSCGYGHS